ncbi:hypothetical protein PI125_g7119 [Phytophthora idaei]|nr:hypothetical protein PI125_g7119 [Phytophthora idaei]KAG3128840.1 hypothetical protein PI126_g21218 [Phytophthora idaei]
MSKALSPELNACIRSHSSADNSYLRASFWAGTKAQAPATDASVTTIMSGSGRALKYSREIPVQRRCAEEVLPPEKIGSRCFRDADLSASVEIALADAEALQESLRWADTCGHVS